jgi:hypothetical protein
VIEHVNGSPCRNPSLDQGRQTFAEGEYVDCQQSIVDRFHGVARTNRTHVLDALPEST